MTFFLLLDHTTSQLGHIGFVLLKSTPRAREDRLGYNLARSVGIPLDTFLSSTHFCGSINL